MNQEIFQAAMLSRLDMIKQALDKLIELHKPSAEWIDREIMEDIKTENKQKGDL